MQVVLVGDLPYLHVMANVVGLPTCYRLAADLLATRPTSPQQVVVIWETTRHNRHNGLLPSPTCYGLVIYAADLWLSCYGEVANLLRTCYGETGVWILA